MDRDPSVLLLGEDVGIDGGVFKTNQGLIEAFGDKRILNTPICENSFVGAAIGMAAMGLRPVVEIMFADFLPTAGDAIVNELPKLRFMSGGQVMLPVTIRVACGGTGRFAAQHSATGESWYLGIPGLRIAAASSPSAAYGLLRRAIQSDDPTIVFEHKAMYSRRGTFDPRAPLPKVGEAALLRSGTSLTIVATLLMVERALEAAAQLALAGVEAEVIDLRWIKPMDADGVARSVEKTGRLLVVEEQPHEGGWGATLISILASRGVKWQSPPRSLSIADIPMPFSPPLEDSMVPTVDSIIEAAHLAMAGS
jgi:pyruvate dehydrogenase E1 component beta subunit